MVGAIIITHGRLAEALLSTAESIAGSAENVRAVCIEGGQTTEDIKETLVEALKGVDIDDGIIIFTDMFGGTPTNIALPLLEEDGVEIFTGVNLPVLLKFLNKRDDLGLGELTRLLFEHGQKSMVLASDMIKGGK